MSTTAPTTPTNILDQALQRVPYYLRPLAGDIASGIARKQLIERQTPPLLIRQAATSLRANLMALLDRDWPESKLLGDPTTPTELSPRELECAKLVAAGCTTVEIAQRWGRSHRTVDNTRTNMMRKICAHNAADVTRWAAAMGQLPEQQ